MISKWVVITKILCRWLENRDHEGDEDFLGLLFVSDEVRGSVARLSCLKRERERETSLKKSWEFIALCFRQDFLVSWRNQCMLKPMPSELLQPSLGSFNQKSWGWCCPLSSLSRSPVAVVIVPESRFNCIREQSIKKSWQDSKKKAREAHLPLSFLSYMMTGEEGSVNTRSTDIKRKHEKRGCKEKEKRQMQNRLRRDSRCIEFNADLSLSPQSILLFLIWQVNSQEVLTCSSCTILLHYKGLFLNEQFIQNFVRILHLERPPGISTNSLNFFPVSSWFFEEKSRFFSCVSGFITFLCICSELLLISQMFAFFACFSTFPLVCCSPDQTRPLDFLILPTLLITLLSDNILLPRISKERNLDFGWFERLYSSRFRCLFQHRTCVSRPPQTKHITLLYF